MRSIRLNPFIYQSWYNLGVFVRDVIHALHSTVLKENKQYDTRNRTTDAYEGFEKCLERNPDLPDVQARFNVLSAFKNGERNVPDDYKIKKMLKCDLMATVDESDNIGGAEIVLKPIIDAKNSE